MNARRGKKGKRHSYVNRTTVKKQTRGCYTFTLFGWGFLCGFDILQPRADDRTVHELEVRELRAERKLDSLETIARIKEKTFESEIKALRVKAKEVDELEGKLEKLWAFIDERTSDWNAAHTTSQRNARIIDKHH